MFCPKIERFILFVLALEYLGIEINSLLRMSPRGHRIAATGALTEDGKFGDVRIYIVGGLASGRRIEFFAQQLQHLVTRIERVQSRLAGPLNPETTKDPQRRQNLGIWRQLSEDLPSEIGSMIETATRLARWMNNGITKDNYLKLKDMRLDLVMFKQDAQIKLTVPGCDTHKLQTKVDWLTSQVDHGRRFRGSYSPSLPASS